MKNWKKKHILFIWFCFGKIKDILNLVVAISNEWNDKMSIQTMVKVYPIEREREKISWKVNKKSMILLIERSYETLKKKTKTSLRSMTILNAILFSFFMDTQNMNGILLRTNIKNAFHFFLISKMETNIKLKDSNRSVYTSADYAWNILNLLDQMPKGRCLNASAHYRMVVVALGIRQSDAYSHCISVAIVAKCCALKSHFRYLN